MSLIIAPFGAEELAAYVTRQMDHFFPHSGPDDAAIISAAMGEALHRLEHCFVRINYRSYSRDGNAHLSIYHSDQYAAFLVLLSNQIHREQAHHPVAQKLFGLNKALHGLNCMYDVELPPVFWLLHSVGAVIGKAVYGNYLVVRQNCTIGALRGEYPVIGSGFIMSSGCSLIGRCVVGDNVMLGPDTALLEKDIPSDTLVTGHYALELKYKPLSKRALAAHFHHEL
jgi:serine O-acetyltransferase